MFSVVAGTGKSHFKKGVLYFTRESAKAIKEGEKEASLDLGLTVSDVSGIDFSKIPLGDVKGDFAYAWDGRELFKLAVFDNGFYRLRMFFGVPILEIDGLRMHLVRDFKTPLDYSRGIVERLGIGKADRVLDTCMGLGYTALAAGKAGAQVDTCEISRAAYELARWNPHSAGLFSGKGYYIHREDALGYVMKARGQTYSAIIHDPPRFSKAPLLYSGEFYKGLARISKKGCRLFHYTGSLGAKSAKRDIKAEVSGRLAAAGWKIIEDSGLYQGIFCLKK